MMEAMPNTEFIEWQAWFQLKSEDEEAALEEAKQNSR
jgi:hypothetical protein